MAETRIEIKCNDIRGAYFPNIPSYPRGVEVEFGDVLKVTQKEAKYFLSIRNGSTKCYVENKPKRRIPENNAVEEL